MNNLNITEDPNIIEAQEVLGKLKISLRTLQRWCKDGTIPYTKIGSKCYFRKSEILAVLEKNYIGKKES